MRIADILAEKKPTLSFEVFPPKTSDNFDRVEAATNAIADLHPDFMSVTYGAGGSTQRFTTEIASNVSRRGTVPLAHLTCVNATKEGIVSQLEELKCHGIHNILALRGDLPEGITNTENWEFQHASDLVREIKAHGDFCVGGACYPEKHPESSSIAEDIKNMKLKQDAGCEFFTTQMFFDNSIFYNYMYKLREAGVTVPVVAGIMPVTNVKQMERILKLSQAFIPRRFVAILDRYGDNPAALKQAALAYATDQIIDLLANGIHNIHIYTMNKPEIAKALQANLSEIVPSCKKGGE